MKKSTNIGLLLVFLIIYLAGAWKIDLMDHDATQYASISMQMHESGEHLKIKYREVEYLDKPPLLFWLASTSFHLFGVSHFAYRLPSILIMLLGIYSTYMLGRYLYDEKTGWYSALILATVQGVLQATHDVRADTMLIGFVIFSTWQLAVYIDSRKWISFIFGFAGIGLAMLTKGPIGLMVPLLALGSQLVYHRRWKEIFNLKWFLGPIIILVILLPMMIGLYEQHGWHGLKFFFWTQSFGRLTGENYWVDNTGPFFFVHTLLWTFLPWSLLTVLAIVKQSVLLLKDHRSGKVEVLTFGGFLLTFIAFSLSQYKLPHYIFVTFPYLAIITAGFVARVSVSPTGNRLFRSSWAVQLFVDVVLWIALGLILVFVFPGFKEGLGILLLVIFVMFFYSLFRIRDRAGKIMMPAILTMMAAGLVFNFHFYPELTKFQAGSLAGKYAREHHSDDQIICFKQQRASFDFYYRKQLQEFDHAYQVDSVLKKDGPVYVYLHKRQLIELQDNSINYQIIKEFPEFRVSMLTAEFLDKHTREYVIEKCYLVKASN